MRGSTVSQSYTRRDGRQTTYRYGVYRCPGSQHNQHPTHTCEMPVQNVQLIDDLVWQWIKEEIASPEVLERKLREIQAAQREQNSDKEHVLTTLQTHKTELAGQLKRLAALYAHSDMPARIVDELIAEKSHALKLTESELTKLEQELATPLSEEIITDLLAFSEDFKARLDSVEESFAGRRAVIDGLDVKAVVFRQHDATWLRLTSILRPTGTAVQILPTHFHTS